MFDSDSRGSGSRRGWFRALAGMAVAVLAVGADEPKKTIEAGGLTFKAPEAWKTIPTRSTMRVAQLQVEPKKGDDFPALLVVYAFPGGAGTVDANVKRWQSQFKDADGNPPKIESKTVKGKNVEVTRVETAGHYSPRRSRAWPPSRSVTTPASSAPSWSRTRSATSSRWSGPTRPWTRSAPRSTS